MKFLEAHRIVRELEGGTPLRLRLAMSGTADALLVYLAAAAAQRGYRLEPQLLPFNTLRQFLLEGDRDPSYDRHILLPWDLVPELDWRSGFPDRTPDDAALAHEVEAFLHDLGGEGAQASGYVPAPLPPIHPDPTETRALAERLVESMRARGADIWPGDWFSMAAYLSSGTPFASVRFGDVAARLVESLVSRIAEPRKLLVTDLDGVLWRGVVGEDGPGGIECGPEGGGYRHFLYQTFLRNLRRKGVLLAAVSRNDPALVRTAYSRGPLLLDEADFVTTVASYRAKSAQIRQMTDALDLGPQAVVFVDDNPVELAEVEAALPEARCVRFPERDDELPAFFHLLAGLFVREKVTDEDRERTTLYRRRLETLPPSEARGADLTRFLEGLGMRLVVRDRTSGDRARAVQLINKTNQFNLNGIRRDDDEIARILSEGGRLYTASLADRTGSHGEIVACLLDGQGRVRSLVMSCRVFERRVEDRFFRWLAERGEGTSGLEFHATERNEPIRSFLERLGVELPAEAGNVRVPREAVLAETAGSEALFRLEEPWRKTDPELVETAPVDGP